MASSSTSSDHKSYKYDVFLSFRGEDTRTNFVDHLYTALQQKSIHTYKDDERIKKGKRISDELIGSIKESRFYIIVFSKNYASSSWCLDELVEIMECHKTTEHTAYPVFYNVEPTEVRKQSGAVEEAFSKHTYHDKASKWRGALQEAADLAGWELKNTADGHEAKFIQKIIEEISLELRSISFSFDDEKLVGLETRVENVLSSLQMGTDDVRMIGIWGMGGAGKTTLARAVFDHISFRFEGKCFVENVREVSNASLNGLKTLQNQILLDALNDKDISVSGVHDGKNMLKKRMSSTKVLLVLDDVDHLDQLQALAGDISWFKPGSRIIITTRDEQVLVAHRVKLILGVNLLSRQEAICLFSRYAFGKEIPIQGYEEQSGRVIDYAAGLPLTIKVLGSFLCGKDESEWIDAIERLETIPLTETLKKLELSYIGLDEDYKEMFLDVACILKGEQKEKVIKILESCGFHARNGLRVLQQKSLITIHCDDDDDDDEYVSMHDHLEELGKNIVRRLHPDRPNEHSRLWIEKEVVDVLANELGTEATRYIEVSTQRLSLEIIMKGLRKMKELRYLVVHNAYRSRNWKCNELGSYFPNSLRYLSWYDYPLRSLPKTYQADNLVSLEMECSQIIQLCEEGERKVFNKLRFLNLSHSKLRALDLGIAPNIEELSLFICVDLVELNIPVGCLKLRSININRGKLRILNLQSAPNIEELELLCTDLVELHMPGGCPKLESVIVSNSKLTTLDLGIAPNLRELTLFECVDLVEFNIPVGCLKLRSIDINGGKLRILNLRSAPNIEELELMNCTDLVELHMPGGCPKLESVVIMGNSKLTTLDLGIAPNLRELDLFECVDLVEFNIPVGCLKLRSINIDGGKLRIHSALNLEVLELRNCTDLVELHMPGGCPKLKSVVIAYNSKLRTHAIGLAPNLEKLSLLECVDLVEFNIPVGCLKLRSINISGGNLRILNLQLAPNLEVLELENCTDLVELHMPGGCPKLKSVKAYNSKLRTFDFGLAPNLVELDLHNCYDLEELHMADVCQRLANLDLSHSKLKTIDLGLAPNLKKLNLKGCKDLVELHAPTGCLKEIVDFMLSNLRFRSFYVKALEEVDSLIGLHLVARSLERCPFHPDSNLPKFHFTCFYKDSLPLGNTNLERLISEGMCACTNLKTFSRSICGLQRLRKLKLEGYPEVPMDLYRLEYLQVLILSSTKIKHLPDIICMLPNLESLKLKSCLLLEKLPEDLGQLEYCLKKLTLSSTMIKYLPDSICTLKHLKSLELIFCWLLEKLPEDIGQLECLESLTLSSGKIKHLPDSICMLKRLKSLQLKFCWLLEKLPEDIGQLEYLEKVNVSCTKIRDLPDGIYMLNHLRVFEMDR